MSSFEAQVRDWTEKAKKNMTYVIRGSVQDIGELMTRTQPSVKETGGFYREGFVPVDTSELINSQEVTINGSLVAEGLVDYSLAVAGYNLGDSLVAVFTAEHARPIEYGVTGRFGGRFYVRNAVQQWSTIVEMNAAQFR